MYADDILILTRDLNELQKAIESNKYNQYQSQLQNANTIQSTLNQNELAKLRALSQLSGYDYTDFLNRSIT